MGTREVEFHTPRMLGRVMCKSYKKQMLIISIKAKKAASEAEGGWGENKHQSPVCANENEAQSTTSGHVTANSRHCDRVNQLIAE